MGLKVIYDCTEVTISTLTLILIIIEVYVGGGGHYYCLLYIMRRWYSQFLYVIQELKHLCPDSNTMVMVIISATHHATVAYTGFQGATVINLAPLLPDYQT